MESKEFKFCPSCHLINKADEINCVHCGKPFDSASQEFLPTTKVDRETRFFPESVHEKIKKMSRQAPAEGVAIYVSDQTRPIEICLEDEFVIGRSIDGSDEKIVDLSLYDAYNQGVSRRHLMIRRTGNTWNVTDLNSTNGTRVNGQSLHPQRPLSIKSGSQIRLGKMHIFIVFR